LLSFLILNNLSCILGQGVGFELAKSAFVLNLQRGVPGHVKTLLKSRALVTVLVQEGRAYIDGLLADVLPGIKVELRGILDRLPCNFFVILIIEGEDSTQHEVGDNTERPKIYLLTVGLL